MKQFLSFLFSLFLCSSINASSIKASQIPGHPYLANNATDAFQSAGNFAVDTVIIDFVGNGDWIINTTTFFNLTNKTFLFENEVKLIAAAGYGLNDALLTLRFCNNVKLIGTNTLFKMQKAEYTTGEFRHCFAILDCENIEVSNFIMQDSGGDGIFIAAFAAAPAKQYSENIILKNIICDNNRRQGISLISVQNLLVEHCSFKNTKGTLPEAGLDIEPDLATERIVNVEFRKCSFTSNFGNGIQLAMLNLRNTSAPVSITFNDCYISQNSITTNTAPNSFYQKCEISAGASDANFVTGTVNFNRCLVENSQWSAVVARKAANAYGVNFNDCVFRNVSQTNVNFNNPIWFELVSYDAGNNIPFGGVNFYNQLIDFSSNMAFMQVYGSNTNNANLGNVAGNISIKNNTANTNPVYISATNEPSANYTNNFIANYQSTNLDVASTIAAFSEIGCNKKIYTYTRTGLNNSLPLPITYTLAGMATNEKDYFHMPSFAIIPSAINTINDTIIAFYDGIVEVDESINLITNMATNYSIDFGGFSTILKDGKCPIVLPVKFISVNVKKQNAAHLIQFTVDNEENNVTYFIEKSINGIDFYNIGKIEISFANTGYVNHRFTDENPFNGQNFYRIKQIENNKTYFSKTVDIYFSKNEISIYPNPTNGFFKIENFARLKSIQIYNTKAELVLSLNNNQNNFNISTIVNGIYFLKVIDENNIISKIPFVKF